MKHTLVSLSKLKKEELIKMILVDQENKELDNFDKIRFHCFETEVYVESYNNSSGREDDGGAVFRKAQINIRMDMGIIKYKVIWFTPSGICDGNINSIEREVIPSDKFIKMVPAEGFNKLVIGYLNIPKFVYDIRRDSYGNLELRGME